MYSAEESLAFHSFAKSLIKVRWITVPLTVAFAYLAVYKLGMSFKAMPVFVLSTLLAAVNIYLTVHASFLSRQRYITRGQTTLRRLLSYLLTKFSLSLKESGLKYLLCLPALLIKILGIIYLMILEALRDFHFNPLSLANQMHLQVICDLLFVVALIRLTGTTESPAFILAVLPIAVAGYSMGSKVGYVYAALTSISSIGLALAVKKGLLQHWKFYSPMLGDLSQSGGWIAAAGFVMVGSFFSVAHISGQFAKALLEQMALKSEKIADLKVVVEKKEDLLREQKEELLSATAEREAAIKSETEAKNDMKVLQERFEDEKKRALSLIDSNEIQICKIHDLEKEVAEKNCQLHISDEGKDFLRFTLNEMADLRTMTNSEPKSLFEFAAQALSEKLGCNTYFAYIMEDSTLERNLKILLDSENLSLRLTSVLAATDNALRTAMEEKNACLAPHSVLLNERCKEKAYVAFLPLISKDKIKALFIYEKSYFSEEHATDASRDFRAALLHLSNVKNVIEDRELSQEREKEKGQLNRKIQNIYTQLDLFKSIVSFNRSSSQEDFMWLLMEASKILSVKDAAILRMDSETDEAYVRLDRTRSLKLLYGEAEALELLKAVFFREPVQHKLGDSFECVAFPLTYADKRLGVLFLHRSTQRIDQEATSFCVRVINDNFALHVMNHERRLWESFYQENLSA
ncbi:MAG: hypothetical protein GX221_08125 [Candidatus Riflebacteria bacterium]|nr:hypothetical protein [Candidatus Riflebacteria bacterium]